MSARNRRLPNDPRRGNSRLTVTRRPGESIHIGHDVIVTVVEVSRSEVRLAVEAPVSVPIHRHEHLSSGRPDPMLSTYSHYANPGASQTLCTSRIRDVDGVLLPASHSVELAERRRDVTCPACQAIIDRELLDGGK